MVNKVPIRDRLRDEVVMGFLCITKCDYVFLDRVSFYRIVRGGAYVGKEKLEEGW